MTFSKFDEPSSPLFKNLNIINLHDLVSYQLGIFRYSFKNYYLPKVRTNYGKFNIWFQAPVFWIVINEQIKTGSFSKCTLSVKKNQYLSL